MIFKLFRKESEQDKIASILYEAIVAQARQPAFYIDYEVEDTINGRFEMIVLHAYMLFHRLRDEDEKTKELGQAVFDRFFRDMDDSLRERGVGDLSVPKKIKKMAQAFYGRVDAYDKAREGGMESLTDALMRNVYPEQGADMRPKAQRMARYMLDSDKILLEQSPQTFAAGVIEFAAIPTQQND